MRYIISAAVLCVSLAVATPAPPANDCPQASASQTFANGVTCQKTCLGDRHGGDYKAVKTGSFAGCGQACANEPTGLCLTAQYNEGNGFCYLKNNVNALDISTTNTDTWDCCPGPVTYTTSAGTTVCTPLCSTDRLGGDYDRAETHSYAECIRLCGADPTCVTAQFHVNNGFCYFKNTVNTAQSDIDVETVDCVFTPSS